MTAAAKPDTLAAALVAAQAEMPKVEADSKNPHFNSMFVSLDHLIAKTRPVLNKHGLAITQEPSQCYGGAPALKTTLIHVSGEFREELMPLLVDGQNMQKLGAALTYARRFAWAAVLGISEREDDDGTQASASTVERTVVGRSGGTAAGAGPAPAATSSQRAEFQKLAETRAQLDAGFDLQGALAKAKGKDADWFSLAIARGKNWITAAIDAQETFPENIDAPAKAAA